MKPLVLLALCLTLPLYAEFEWQPADPVSQGMSKDKLDALRDSMAKQGTRALLIVRHDRIVYEWYAQGNTADTKQGTASLAKAMVGGMSAAVAIQDHRLDPGDPASKYIQKWKDDPKKSKITVAMLGTHTSGLDDAHDPVLPHEKLPGWKGEFWKKEPRDPFTISRDDVPVIYEPGERVSYSNPGIGMLTYAVTAAEQKDIRSLLAERVYGPIGMKPKEWSIGYGQTYRVDGLNLVASWGGGAFTPRAAARVGRLMLRNGDWDGTRILDEAVVKATVHPPGVVARNQWEGESSPSPGFGWWTNRDNAWPSVPRDLYTGAGAGDQLLIVVPSLDLICVRNGVAITDHGDTSNHWRTLEKLLLGPLVAAVEEKAPHASSVIRAVHFDPDETIVRKALDSDNWPITWADDGHLYTAYGDGHGFEPLIKPKLSLGFAKVVGGPRDFQGINIRSSDGERTGNGAAGAKASGMLMVDGVLYMWVRNTHNATLAWSSDHGVTWEWGFTFDTSYGCPTFLNFGPNHAGAADDYVYTFSQDGPGAYEPYDGVVLARVPKGKIRERQAYEFFQGVSKTGQPAWTKDIKSQVHTFHYPGHCERLDVIYNPGIKRYLMTVDYGHGKGWGIYDAPQPWGPWTTAFTTTDWGQGQTHDYRLPTKWISADGKEMWLVFSGTKQNDAFCVRRMTLETNP